MSCDIFYRNFSLSRKSYSEKSGRPDKSPVSSYILSKTISIIQCVVSKKNYFLFYLRNSLVSILWIFITSAMWIETIVCQTLFYILLWILTKKKVISLTPIVKATIKTCRPDVN